MDSSDAAPTKGDLVILNTDMIISGGDSDKCLSTETNAPDTNVTPPVVRKPGDPVAHSTPNGFVVAYAQVNTVTIKNIGNAEKTEVFRLTGIQKIWDLPQGKSITIQDNGEYLVRNDSEQQYIYILFDASSTVHIDKRDLPADGAFEITCLLSASHSNIE